MQSDRPRRRRGVILTPKGLQKLQEAISVAEQQERFGERFTQEDLRHRLDLDPGTVAKVLNREKVDRKSLEAFFRAFALELDPEDFTISDPGQRQSLSGNARVDWSEAVDVSIFYGRTEELTTLEQWIMRDRCRIVALLGMGGIGKTSLVAKLGEKIQGEFECVVWRSLKDAPPLKEVITHLIQFISNYQRTEADLPETVQGRITKLVECLRNHRCLMILDNAESILQAGEAGIYQSGYEDYGSLLTKLGEIPHQSCVIITSREKFKEISVMKGEGLLVRSLQLKGLAVNEAQRLLEAKGLSALTTSATDTLIQNYQGNPLALKIISTPIQEVFDGDISKFLEEGITVFGDIQALLNEQFNRLSELEKGVMYWLAIVREPISMRQLREVLIIQVTSLQESLNSLLNRSLIERVSEHKGSISFTLQPVVMEYMIAQFIEHSCQEILANHFLLLKAHGLVQAQASDYVQEAQLRLILTPVKDKLTSELGGKTNLRQHLSQILSTARENDSLRRTYVAGNILNLLLQSGVDLTGYDLSNLTIWQACFQEKFLHQVNLANSDLTKSIFTETLETIISLGFSPDGKLLATGDANGELRVWQIEDGKQSLICRGHTDWIRSVSFSPDGKTLMSGSGDKTLKLWDVHTGQCLKTFEGHTDRVRSVKFSPDGQVLVSGSADQTVRLWDIKTKSCMRIFQGHTDRVRSVAFSSDGSLVASGSEDQTIKLWNLQESRCIKTLEGHQHWVRSIDFSPDGKTIASGSFDQTIKLWSVITGECLETLEGHDDAIRLVRFSPDGCILASSSDDQTIRLWDGQTGESLNVLQGHSHWVRAIAFSPNSQLLASGSADRTVKLWDLKSQQCIRTIYGYTNWIRSIAFHPDGQTIVSGSADQQVRRWDVQTGEYTNIAALSSWVQTVTLSPNGRMLACGSGDKLVRIHDLNTGKCLPLRGHENRVLSVAFSPDGYTLASGGDFTIRLWSVSTNQYISGELLETLEGHTGTVRAVAFSPDGQTLASGSEDKTLRLWDVRTGACIRRLTHHHNHVCTVAFSPDGFLLASGGGNGAIFLWDFRSGRFIRALEGHSKQVRSIAFHPEGNILASASSDETVRLWGVNQGQCIQVLEQHSSVVCSVKFSPNGRELASAGRDGTIRLWDVQTGSAIKVLQTPRPYEGMNITGIQGLTETQKTSLIALGAVESNG